MPTIFKSILLVFGLDNNRKINDEWKKTVDDFKHSTETIRLVRADIPNKLRLAREKLEDGRSEISRVSIELKIN